jgi:rubrerythrin
MKEFTIREIVEHAEKIEAESRKFYLTASEKLTDSETVDLTRELAEEEIKHFNHLRDLLNESKLSASELDKFSGGKIDLHDRIVKTAEITEDSDPVEVLEVALDREISTENLYKMYLTLTDLPDNFIKVFDDLRLQEVGHQNRIKTLIKKILGK